MVTEGIEKYSSVLVFITGARDPICALSMSLAHLSETPHSCVTELLTVVSKAHEKKKGDANMLGDFRSID
jgi:hypothetical protein